MRPFQAAFPLAVTAVAFAFLGLFLVYPLATVFEASFLDRSGTAFTLANYLKVLSTGFYRQAIWNSLWIGLLTAAASTVIAVPMAFCLARLPLPGKPLLLSLVVLPLVLPSFVGAYAWVLLLGRSGVLTRAAQSLVGSPGTELEFAL